MELVFFLIIFELNRYSACISLNIKQKAQIPLFFKLIRKYREKTCFYKSIDKDNRKMNLIPFIPAGFWD
jgi:hypothetical protein